MPNGIVTTYGRLGQRLREMGHEVFYVTGTCEAPDPWVTVIDPFSELTLFDRLRYKLNFDNAHFSIAANSIAGAVEHLVRNNSLEIFQMEETNGWARKVIQRVPIPVVVRLDGPWFLHSRMHSENNSKLPDANRIKREGKALHVAAGVTAPSRNVLDLATKFYGRPRCPTEVIPSPIAVKPYSARWRINNCDRNLILFVGRFDRHKGADILLAAFAKLAQQRPRIRLAYVGPDAGLSSNGGGVLKFGDYINAKIPSALFERIEYRGLLPDIELEKLRTEAYLTVVCSRYETFGSTVIEAMATGCPTIATHTGGIPEIITDGRNGLLVPPEDVGGLTEAITRLLDDPNLALRLGGQAARDCCAGFDPTTIAQRFVDFYSAVIARYKEGLRGGRPL